MVVAEARTSAAVRLRDAAFPAGVKLAVLVSATSVVLLFSYRWGRAVHLDRADAQRSAPAGGCMMR